MKLGLGSGTTAEVFVKLLAERVRDGLKLSCASTSDQTAALAQKLGITVGELDDIAPLDLTIDGADEAQPDLILIKGGGGRLLREKIVAVSSKQMLVIADETKLVERLGKFPLPIEVIRFGYKTTVARLTAAFKELGYGAASMKLRERDGKTFITDSGNVIFDCTLGAISDPRELATVLEAIPGVVDHGLFIDIATTALIAGSNGITVLERVPNSAR